MKSQELADIMIMKKEVMRWGYTTDEVWHWVSAPTETLTGTASAIVGVYLRDDEDVEWKFEYNEDGTRRVAGHKIVKKARTTE